MFPGSYDEGTWGKQYGGFDNREDCTKLPEYPTNKVTGSDNEVTLCQLSFDRKTRGEGGANPTIKDLARVKCPAGL